MNIKLRQRKQTRTGKISLYLDVYKGTVRLDNGRIKVERTYEYLNLYLYQRPKDHIEKHHNKETLSLAESIRSKRFLEIKSGQHGLSVPFKKNANFIKYFHNLVDARAESKGNFGNWDSALKHLIKYSSDHVTFEQIDKKFIEGFKDYLTNALLVRGVKPLAKNSASSYFAKFKATLNQAIEDGIISYNPAKSVKSIPQEDSVREYLTIEELRKLVNSECRYPVLKQAFLFSCYTGLRWVDIMNLHWKDVRSEDSGAVRILFKQQKTQNLEYLDINEQARKLLGKKSMDSEKIFNGLRYSAYMNVALSQWILKAGITKQITFHCARHTHAVLLLNNGADIYTVSKLLGHKNVKTTELYSKIMDQTKINAVNRLPEL